MEEYRKATEYLFQLQRMGIKLGLENTLTLLKALDNPHQQFPAIHIAGTNGKGSTAAIMESILLKAGFKVGLYTSPHLIDFTERIRVNRHQIDKEAVVELTNQLRPLIEAIQPSFFEVTTAMAFCHFAWKGIDIAVVETGMGGRLDSTNVLTPCLTVITPISYDHQNYLGNTLVEIAREKGGIIKPGVPCITSNRDETVLKVLSNICTEKTSSFWNIFDNSSYRILSNGLRGVTFRASLGDRLFEKLHVNLPGEHQAENALLAIAALDQLKNDTEFSTTTIIDGLRSVLWRGRIQLVSEDPVIIIDVSHNPEGFQKTLGFIGKCFPKESTRVIILLQDDKDFQQIGKLTARNTFDTTIMKLNLGKPLESARLKEVIEAAGGKARVVESFAEIIPEIYGTTGKNILWLISGSHYLAGEAFKHLLHIESFQNQQNELAIGQLS